jgi:Co/Zn/Cd efflux system component
VSNPLDAIAEPITHSQMDGKTASCMVPAEGAHLSPAYKRAMWIVVLLNVGYGCLELIAGFVAESQGLRADALDFLGDGAISLIGLIAIGWRPIWRARVALLQGLFLAVLGLSVLASTVYRLFEPTDPDANVMGAVGIGALAVNLIAAYVLIPHRHGDANMRAVWHFSRNDALGNIAIVTAAILVAISGAPWPDLAVAFVISCLFLQSAQSIVRHAIQELRSSEDL